MALQKILVPLDFTQGADTKTDDKLGAKPTVLENGVFSEQKSLTRRNGHALVDDLESFGLGADGLLTSLGDGLVAQDKTKTHAISTTFNAAKDVGRSSRYIATKRRVVRRTTLQKNADHAAVSGLVIYAWQDNDGTTTRLKFCVYEEASGVYLVPETTLSTNGRNARCLAFSDRLAVIYCDSANLKITYVTVAAPTTSTTVTMQTNYNNSQTGRMDAALTSSSTMVVGYSATADIRTFIANSAGTVTVAAVTHADTVSGGGMRVGVFTNGNILVIYASNTSSDTRRIVYSSSLVVVAAAATVAIKYQLLAPIEDVANQLTIFMSLVGSSADDTRYVVINSSGTITTALTVFSYFARVASDPFLLSGRLMIGLTSEETGLQQTIFVAELVSGAKKVVAALLRSLAGDLAAGTDTYRVASVRTRTTTTGTWPVLLLGERGKLEFQGTNDVTRVGVSEIMLEPDLAGYDVERTRLAPVEYGRSLYFPGAQVMQFDGVATYEAGFNLYPEFTTPPAQGAGGSLADGTYQYVAVYEFVDGQGQLHRSAPSVPASVTISAGGGTAKTTFQLRELSHTDKAVNIVLYRTLANGTTFYRINAVAAPIISASPMSSYSDTSTDATIATQEVLYTSGELENAAPPAAVFAHVHQRRLVLVQAENRQRLSISDERSEGYGPTFNEATEYDCGASYGDVLGVGSIDDKLILLKERGLEYVAGDGPDRAGLQNTWTAPQFITSDTGCKSAASIVQTPDGIMFKGERGLYLLDRGLRLVWLGEEVESLTGRISSAVLVPQKSQIRFACPEVSRVLCYDYAARQWSTFTGLQFDSMLVLGGTMYALTRGGDLWSESSSAAGDNSASIPLTVVTSWVKPAGVQGFQRVTRALLVGDAGTGTTTVLVEVAYDYSDTYQTLGTASLTSSGTFQIRGHLSKQKCAALRFRITATNTGAPGFSISNLTLEVGAKRGARKLPAAQTI